MYESKQDESFPIILVGNKCDLDESKRQIPRSRAGGRAQIWNVGYVETSAKSGLNVNKVFCDLIRDIQSRKLTGEVCWPSPPFKQISIEQPSNHLFGSCLKCMIL